jgi:predicted O-linked N-acetylglucosamine transferase (SPINDLY family)
VLWLPSADAEAKSRLLAAASAHGVAAERLVFAAYLPSADEHLARLPLADVFLDTLPYNAHATANDALWMGVPVLTQSGGTFAGRVAASLLHALDVPELIAKTAEEYETLALRLARDRNALSRLREKLARNRAAAPLFDTTRYCRDLETAFWEIWERHQRLKAPAHFSVAG